MSGSSELSDALNPYYYHSRQPSGIDSAANSNDAYPVGFTANYPGNTHNINPPVHTIQTESVPYVPHRSELENAVNPTVATQTSPIRPSHSARP